MSLFQKVAFLLITAVGCSAQAINYPSRPTHDSLVKTITEKQKLEKKLPVNNSDYKSLDNEQLNALFINLTARGTWVDLPKRSIIHVPKHLKKHISEKPIGKYSNWKGFLQRNSAIVYELRVTRQQSFGREKLSSEQVDAYKKLNKIVVATFNGAPVTVAKNAIEDTK